MTIENGNVLVFRDGEMVRGVLYRKYYAAAADMAEDAKNFIQDRELAEPNISFMQIVDSKFTKVDDEDFRLEFFELLSKMGFAGYAMCEKCDSPMFVWLKGEYKAYCPYCKEVFQD